MQNKLKDRIDVKCPVLLGIMNSYLLQYKNALTRNWISPVNSIIIPKVYVFRVIALIGMDTAVFPAAVIKEVLPLCAEMFMRRMRHYMSGYTHIRIFLLTYQDHSTCWLHVAHKLARWSFTSVCRLVEMRPAVGWQAMDTTRIFPSMKTPLEKPGIRYWDLVISNQMFLPD